MIAINNAGWLAPWADLLYFCDRKWFTWHGAEAWFRAFEGRIVKGSLDDRDCVDELGIKNLLLEDDYGYMTEPDRIAHGRNSGYAAIHIAARRKASRIILIGYDLGFQEGEPTHWHGGHPVPNKEDTYKIMRERYPSLAAALAGQVEVINCTPTTRLVCFPIQTLEEALP